MYELASLALTLGSWVRIPFKTWMFCVCVRLFCVCVTLFVSSGLATGCPRTPTVWEKWLRNWIRGQGPKWAEEPLRKENNIPWLSGSLPNSIGVVHLRKTWPCSVSRVESVPQHVAVSWVSADMTMPYELWQRQWDLVSSVCAVVHISVYLLNKPTTRFFSEYEFACLLPLPVCLHDLLLN
jgi:hypothetical protein